MKTRNPQTRSLTWRRPCRIEGIVGEWRRYFSDCHLCRVSVRVTGPGCKPYRFYAERYDFESGWRMIGKNPHRTKAAAVKACEREARRAAQ